VAYFPSVDFAIRPFIMFVA